MKRTQIRCFPVALGCPQIIQKWDPGGDLEDQQGDMRRSMGPLFRLQARSGFTRSHISTRMCSSQGQDRSHWNLENWEPKLTFLSQLPWVLCDCDRKMTNTGWVTGHASPAPRNWTPSSRSVGHPSQLWCTLTCSSELCQSKGSHVPEGLEPFRMDTSLRQPTKPLRTISAKVEGVRKGTSLNGVDFTAQQSILPDIRKEETYKHRYPKFLKITSHATLVATVNGCNFLFGSGSFAVSL